MARNILYIGNKNPSLAATLLNGAGAPLNMTGHATVQFALRLAYDSANAFKATGINVTPATGAVRYDFATNDLVGLTAGVYCGQWIDTDAGGSVMNIDAGEFELRVAF